MSPRVYFIISGFSSLSLRRVLDGLHQNKGRQNMYNTKEYYKDLLFCITSKGTFHILKPLILRSTRGH